MFRAREIQPTERLWITYRGSKDSYWDGYNTQCTSEYAPHALWMFYHKYDAELHTGYPMVIYGRSYKVGNRWYRVVDARLLSIEPQEMDRRDHRRDNTHQKVYDWKERYLSRYTDHYVSHEEAVSIIKQLSEEWGILVPKVTFSLTSRHVGGRAFKSTWRIALRKRQGSNKLSTVLHEFAHMVTFTLDDEDPGHGDTFVEVVRMIYDKHMPMYSNRIAASEGDQHG